MNEVIKTLQDGGLIIYPSDTVYALGCDIYNVKLWKNLLVLKYYTRQSAIFYYFCNNLSHLSEFTCPIETSTFRLLKSKIPGPFTFILEKPIKFTTGLQRQKTVGIRVPDHPIPQLIVEKLGHPIASTSIKDDDEVIEYSTDPELIAEKYTTIW